MSTLTLCFVCRFDFINMLLFSDSTADQAEGGRVTKDRKSFKFDMFLDLDLGRNTVQSLVFYCLFIDSKH